MKHIKRFNEASRIDREGTHITGNPLESELFIGGDDSNWVDNLYSLSGPKPCLKIRTLGKGISFQTNPSGVVLKSSADVDEVIMFLMDYKDRMIS